MSEQPKPSPTLEAGAAIMRAARGEVLDLITADPDFKPRTQMCVGQICAAMRKMGAALDIYKRCFSAKVEDVQMPSEGGGYSPIAYGNSDNAMDLDGMASVNIVQSPQLTNNLNIENAGHRLLSELIAAVQKVSAHATAPAPLSLGELVAAISEAKDLGEKDIEAQLRAEFMSRLPNTGGPLTAAPIGSVIDTDGAVLTPVPIGAHVHQNGVQP